MNIIEFLVNEQKCIHCTLGDSARSSFFEASHSFPYTPYMPSIFVISPRHRFPLPFSPSSLALLHARLRSLANGVSLWTRVRCPRSFSSRPREARLSFSRRARGREILRRLEARFSRSEGPSGRAPHRALRLAPSPAIFGSPDCTPRSVLIRRDECGSERECTFFSR